METVRRKKRLNYTGGLISLILLPILCLLYFFHINVFNKVHAIVINWTTEEIWTAREHTDLKTGFFLHPNIDFLNINLNGNDTDNKIKLDNAQLEIRRIVTTKDTTKGVHFFFDKDAKYWTLIKAIDICFIEKGTTFVPYENHLWMYNYFPKPIPEDDKHRPFCGNTAFDYDFSPTKHGYTFEEQIENAKNGNKKFIFESIKEYWFLSVLFALLTILSIRRLMM